MYSVQNLKNQKHSLEKQNPKQNNQKNNQINSKLTNSNSNLTNYKKLINRIETIYTQLNSINNSINKKIFSLDLGLISYNDAYNIQTYFFNKIKDSNITGVILLLEHPPVITIGNNGNLDNLLIDKKKLKEQNIELVHSNRGGDITFHGPGQIVCYPILNLSYIKKDVSLYVYNLEQVLIDLLKHYKIQGRRIAKHRGVFVKNYKIASVGIRIKKWITMHGFSLNVNVNLGYFDYIIACGLKNHPQTSIQKILNQTISISDVKEQILLNFSRIFNLPIEKLKL